MRSKMFRQVAACLAAVMIGTLALAAPASAAWTKACTSYGCSGWGSGYGEWNSNGDSMEICDNYADGWSIMVFNYNRNEQKWRATGKGCTKRSYGNLPEGEEVIFRACLGHLADNYIDWNSCGPMMTAYA